MEIKLVTLKTNHTLVGEVDCIDDTSITIIQPLQVVVQPGKDGTSGIMFVPFIEYAVEFRTGFKLSMNDVLIISSPVKELEDNYRQLFSRIQIASALPKM